MKKYAIVTGGTRGIGRAISLDLAKNGFHVLALYAKNRKAAESLEEEARGLDFPIKTIRGNLSKPDSFLEVIQQLKAESQEFDVIVHSAASGVHKGAGELTQKHLQWTFDINFFAIHNLITELLPSIKPGGRIIGITSTGGQRTIPFYAAVGSSKGAMESLFRHYAEEFAPRDISVNLVCPGMVRTDAVDAFPDGEARIENCLKATPTGRLTSVEDVGELVSFLATSNVARQIVGQTLVIDGGKTLRS